MKKSILSFSAIALLFAFIFFSSCKKKDSIVDETCHDGIQNQNETAVDCGGSCTPCPQSICDGNGTNSYYPLSPENSWSYQVDNSATKDYTRTEKVTGNKVLGNGKTYFTVDYGSKQNYFRTELNGDVYAWKTDAFNDLGTAENLFLPANPVMGTTWVDPYFTPDSFYVKATDAMVTSPNGCTYSNLLKIDVFANGSYYETQYWKRGIGKVHQTSTGILGYTEYLKEKALK